MSEVIRCRRARLIVNTQFAIERRWLFLSFGLFVAPAICAPASVPLIPAAAAAAPATSMARRVRFMDVLPQSRTLTV